MTSFDFSESIVYSPSALSLSTTAGSEPTPLAGPHQETAPLEVTLSETIGIQDLSGLLKAHVSRQISRIPSICLTELDQAFVAWGLIALIIFAIAQFSSLSWADQAVIDAALTGVGVAGTSGLTWNIATIANLRWVVFLWAGLMWIGMALTAYGIFGGVAIILANLCALWMGLCALGYGMMAVGMRSWSFSACFWLHVFAIASLHQQPEWQFLISGLVMSLTLFFFSVVPWDMQDTAPDEPC